MYAYDAANRRTEKKQDTNNNTGNWKRWERYTLDSANATLATGGGGNWQSRYLFGDGPDQV